MNRNKKINRHTMYYHMCNMVSLCSGRRGEVHAQREGLGTAGDLGLTGHNFGHMRVPQGDYTVPLDLSTASITEGMYSVGGHKVDRRLDVGKMTQTLPKHVRPAGSHAGPRMAAAMHLLLHDAAHGFAHCPQAWCCSLMNGVGLVFKRSDGDHFLSLGSRSQWDLPKTEH
jgi:hypothetical protein